MTGHVSNAFPGVQDHRTRSSTVNKSPSESMSFITEVICKFIFTDIHMRNNYHPNWALANMYKCIKAYLQEQKTQRDASFMYIFHGYIFHLLKKVIYQQVSLCEKAVHNGIQLSAITATNTSCAMVCALLIWHGPNFCPVFFWWWSYLQSYPRWEKPKDLCDFLVNFKPCSFC